MNVEKMNLLFILVPLLLIALFKLYPVSDCYCRKLFYRENW